MTTISLQDERRYRRLLLAYPGAYRRRHGDEILTTLFDLADDGNGRLTAGQTLHLVASGVRQRFRVPPRPLTVLAALLAAVTVGGFGATAGNWLAWQSADRVPTPAEAGALTSAMADLPRPSIEQWQTAMNGPGIISTISGAGSYDPDRVKTALTATGWHITSFAEEITRTAIGFGTDEESTIPGRAARFTATKDGLSLKGSTETMDGGPRPDLDGGTFAGVDITTDVTGAIVPLTIAGLLLGAVTGWLLTAAVAYRMRTAGSRHRRTAAGLSALSLTAAAVPAFVAYCEFYQVMTYDPHAPNQYVGYGPHDQIPASAVLIGTALAALSLAAAIRAATHRPNPNLTPVSS
ncbi:hypothetical protein ACQP2E_19440 [Actinoplanes sp. CA-015351]|uniref:hypothetical protein n=1 Tax=Actinoplanes sp. CA-015351 TaxID=3239897 RepID=UPI003D99FF7E